MTPPGHLAVAYLLARRGVAAGGVRQLAPVWMGALLPDLMDKNLQWLGVTPHGRTVGHSVIVWGAVGAAWLVLARRPRVPGLVLLGGFSHLVTDLLDDVWEGLERSGYVFSGWFAWPLTHPDMWNVRCPHWLEPMPHAVTTLELATVAICLTHLARASEDHRARWKRARTREASR